MRGDWMDEARQYEDVDKAVLKRIREEGAAREAALPCYGPPSDHAFVGLITDDQCQAWVKHGDIGCKRRCGLVRSQHRVSK